MAWVEWNVPCLPVKPWQITRVSLFIQTAALDDMDRCCMVVVVVVLVELEVDAATIRRAAVWMVRWHDDAIVVDVIME